MRQAAPGRGQRSTNNLGEQGEVGWTEEEEAYHCRTRQAEGVFDGGTSKYMYVYSSTSVDCEEASRAGHRPCALRYAHPGGCAKSEGRPDAGQGSQRCPQLRYGTHVVPRIIWGLLLTKEPLGPATNSKRFLLAGEVVMSGADGTDTLLECVLLRRAEAPGHDTPPPVDTGNPQSPAPRAVALGERDWRCATKQGFSGR
ncbi:uncharacterized protein B0I36DRAFT_88481 [Microdochium trichocladiopsis]|uniref:Uncharacterized protein n=1 Tax=Microdochium trichocladiopsis TaxID=1682393 RepID=A0A9P8YBY0_9PEZI|nr:uncharacterized protein B0I36DRAFT_88481 [Microdochium trichocladiopsis]KAH7035125.1 hypothetical protein B0I36DRAFT_88481 [Microdochium trichocladiopsis]